QRLSAGPFVEVPPRRRNIRIPVSSRRAAMAGLTLYAPCRRRVLLMHHAGWALVALTGPRSVRGPRAPWAPSTGQGVWDALSEQWEARFGRIDTVAIYQRPQASRSGVSVLLLSEDTPVAFVKLRQDDRLQGAALALSALESRPSPHFEAPVPLATGECGQWRWLAISALPAIPHRPPRRPPLVAIVNDIKERLSGAMPREGAPDHWEPMHGDLTPWNLRRVGLRGLWLLDWESAGWGPPGADLVYYAATASVLLGRGFRRHEGDDEAVQYWQARVARRPITDYDCELNLELRRILAVEGAGPVPSPVPPTDR
ncbi:MAG: phosphotransferase, partial [Acidimicrobiia bacterium]|nr:phosphotransferase [Acidimicrobiia bacterium]